MLDEIADLLEKVGAEKLAEEFAELKFGSTEHLALVDDRYSEGRRWYDLYALAFRIKGSDTLFGFLHEEPSTELQEDEPFVLDLNDIFYTKPEFKTIYVKAS